MNYCFICTKPLGDDDGNIYEAKVRAVRTLLRCSVTRKKEEHERLLENVTEITVHRACYKQYTDLRLSLSDVKNECVENDEGACEESGTESDFDFANTCLLCGLHLPSSRELQLISSKKRKNIVTLKCAKTVQNIRKILTERGDEVSLSILKRVNSSSDLIAAGARYHSDCRHRYVYNKTLTGRPKSRPEGNEVDNAMSDIYSFLEENSDECQFSLSHLMSKVEGDYCPSEKTVRTHLKKKYGDDIIIVCSERGTVVCFKNTGYKLISDAWYTQREENVAEERLRVVRECASILREDIRSVVFDTSKYPPSDDFLQNAQSEVPTSLNVFLSHLIKKGKRPTTENAFRSLNTKCTSIAHAIISAVRPRSFYSSVKIGVGAYLYKKFGSKTLIDVISNLGFCATYAEVIAYENSCIHAGSSVILDGAFSQYIFDNADFNIKTIDGYGTFHAIKEKIRHILQFFFDKGENASQAAKSVNSVYGPDTVTANHAQFWFRRFRFGNFDVKDAPRSGRPIVENVDKIMEIVESDRHVSTVSIAQELNIAQKTVWDHLSKAGYKKKLDVWVPYELTQKNLMDRISICESLLNRNKIDPFLKRMVISDEKWLTYDNVKRKRSWSNRGEPAQTVAKPELTVRKVLLCVWWDWQGIIYYELLPYGQILNSDLYCQQLDRLKEAIAQKRPALANRRGIVFHQDNARPHTSIVTRQKLRELGWEVLMHPPYSSDLAPSDYHLFLSMANDFAGEKFASREACENRLSQFFANRDEGFYERGIMELPSKWQQVIEQNGAVLNKKPEVEIPKIASATSSWLKQAPSSLAAPR